MKTKPCPKCGHLAHKSGHGRHRAVHHGLHTVPHLLRHGHPVLGAIAAGLTGFGLFGAADHYYCRHCDHEF